MNEDLKNVNEALKRFLSGAKEKNSSQDRAAFVGEVSRNVMDIFAPVLQKLADNSKLNKDELAAVIREIQVAAPEVKIPEIKIPAAVVNVPAPIVNIPAVKAPVVNVSPTPINFPSQMSLKPNDKPFPVIMMDQGGKPMMFPQSAGGGRADFFTIKDIQTSTGASIISDSENAIRITGSVTTSGSVSSTLTQMINRDGTFYDTSMGFPVNVVAGSTAGAVGQGDAASATRVVIAGNSDASVVINSGTLTTVTTLTGITNTVTVRLDSPDGPYSAANPLPTTATISLPSGPGDGATATRFIQAGDTISSTNIVTFNGSAPAQGLNETTAGVLRVVQMSDTVNSVVVNSGTITTVTTLTGVTNSVSSALVDSTGIQYSGSNPVPVTLANTGTTINVNNVGGGSDSMFIVMARTTNPTTVSDGADVRPTADKLGRQLSRPIQVRDLVTTAFVQLTTGTEATLLAASAGKQYDLIWVLLSNESTAAVQVDLRAVLAGNKIMSFQVPANGTVGIAPPVPLNATSDTGNAWTVDMPDITGTTVDITALFTQEI